MTYLIWIPAYNEELNVLPVHEDLKTLGHDIVFSDGGSSDKTVKIAKEAGIKIVSRSGKGKGYAVVDGLQFADENGYDYLILIDCDQTYDGKDVPRLIDLNDNHGMIVGRRNFQDIAFARRQANRLMTFILNLLYNAKIEDMASGLRVLKVANFVGKLDAQSFDIEPQMYCVALRDKMKIAEVPIKYSTRSGESKIGIQHLFLAIYRMFKERFTTN